jgi:hypothetical protein
MIRTQQVTVTTTGSAGSASGNANSGLMSGKLVAIHLDFTSQPATTDVTVATAHAPIRTLISVSNTNADGWFYPRVAVQDTSGAAITFDGTHGIYEAIPVNDYITVSVAQGDPNVAAVVATIYVECV